jgi:hypothetical protein
MPVDGVNATIYYVDDWDEPVRREPFGALAAIADPSGNVIGLYEPA